MNLLKRAAITNTIPIEIALAAGYALTDLNNVFVTAQNPKVLIDAAEREGFPGSLCAWIKGVYAAFVATHTAQQPFDCFIGVEEGDCSNTKSLHPLIAQYQVPMVLFGYPQDRSQERLMAALDQLVSDLGTDWTEVDGVWKMLQPLRRLADEVDQLTHRTGQITGFENHLALVSASDMMGHPDQYRSFLEALLENAKMRPIRKDGIRLAYIGVPPMYSDLYSYLDSLGAHVVYNEVQREFSMPPLSSDSDLQQLQGLDIRQRLVNQYLRYTYPYSIESRTDALQALFADRQIDGIIHYTQSFCHRQLDDLYFRKHFKLPMLTLEGDKANCLDSRAKLRIEAFVELLKDQKGARGGIA